MRGEMSRKIAVRMDDITPDMNWENFRFFQGLFDKAGITPLLGIVPECRDEKLHCGNPHEDFYEVMRKLKGRIFLCHTWLLSPLYDEEGRFAPAEQSFRVRGSSL